MRYPFAIVINSPNTKAYYVKNWARVHLSTHRRTTPVSVHPRSNVHAHQLLEKQLRSVRNMDLRNLGLGLAVLAGEFLGFELPFLSLAHLPPTLSSSGGRTYAITVLNPQFSQICILYASLTSNNLSFKNAAAPCAIIQSRSISPKRRPPSLARPSTG
jgi:hypothetical protein